jgi:spore coat assembly protein
MYHGVVYMTDFNVGDIVGRKSYGMDIVFKIVEFGEDDKGRFALLKGIATRIEADAYLDDLEHINKITVDRLMEKEEKRYRRNIEESLKRGIYNIASIAINGKKNKRMSKRPGIILHIDGDGEYGNRSEKYYNDLGLDATVHNIPENKQSEYVYSLLSKHNPDILVITGHDGMIKNYTNYTDINNYKNSKFFIAAVREARRYERSLDELVIFAGACQSFYEALISAGCNFASAPERVFIDLLDPLIVAKKIAMTSIDKVITMDSIAPELKDGYRGIGGINTRGKCRETTIGSFDI